MNLHYNEQAVSSGWAWLRLPGFSRTAAATVPRLDRAQDRGQVERQSLGAPFTSRSGLVTIGARPTVGRAGLPLPSIHPRASVHVRNSRPGSRAAQIQGRPSCHSLCEWRPPPRQVGQCAIHSPLPPRGDPWSVGLCTSAHLLSHGSSFLENLH